MRLLVDATGASKGGMQTYLKGLFPAWKALSPRDEFHFVATPDVTGEVARTLQSVGRLNIVGSTNPLSRIWSQQVRVAQYARDSSADAILCTVPVAPILQRLPPAVVVAHDFRHLHLPHEFSSAQRLYRKVIYPASLKRASIVISNSVATSLDVARLTGKTGEENRVVLLGCDPPPCENMRDTSAPEYALAFGHWSNKRPDFSISVWAALRQKFPRFDIELRIVGVQERKKASLLNLAETSGIGDLVNVFSTVPEDEYWPMVANAKLILMPSTFEGWALPIIEAFRIGIPIVVSSGAGMEEAGGRFAKYADPASAEAFGDVIWQILSDPAKALQESCEARAYSEQFTWSRTATQTRSAIVDAIEQAG